MEMPKMRACSMDLTEGCNLACDYCFTYSQHKRRVLDRGLGERIIDWWLPQTEGEVEISFWGGEPLLEWELLKHLRHYSFEKSKQIPAVKSMRWGATTNGMLYTPDKVEWSINNQCLMMVSIDGIQKVHDLHRKCPGGKGSWETIDKNLRAALKILPTQHVRMSLTPESIPYLMESVKYFCDDLGIIHVAYSPVYELDWTEADWATMEEQFHLLNEYVIKKKLEGSRLVIKHLDDSMKTCDGTEIFHPCGAGRFYGGWSVDGYLFPCHRFNKHGQSSEDRYNSPLIMARPKGDSFEWVNQKWRERFINFVQEAPSRCAGCEIYRKSGCMGGCYAVNFDLTGEIDRASDKECRYQHIQREAGVELKKMLKDNNLAPEQAMFQNTLGGCICYNMCYSEGSGNKTRLLR